MTLAAPALAANPLDLAFGSSPNSKYWTAFTMGTGPTGALVGSEFVITVPSTSQDGIGGTFGTGLTSRCSLSGDFDVVLDYKLVEWPFSNGVRAGIVILVRSGDAITGSYLATSGAHRERRATPTRSRPATSR